MSEATPSATAGATITPASISVPVPPAAVPPTTDSHPPAKPEAAKPADAQKDAQGQENVDGKNDEQPRGDDGKFKPKPTAAERKGRLQGDIDRLTAEKRQLERDVLTKSDEVKRLAKQLSEQTQNDDPNDHAAATRRAVKEERLEQVGESYKQAVADLNAKRVQTFESKIEDARERIPDLDAALQDFMRLPVSEAAADLIAESEKSAEIAYFLAKNPNEAHRIARLPNHLQGAEIARIEAKVSTAPAARKTSNAPPPPPMINGTSSPASKTPAEMSVDEMKTLLYAR